MASSMSLPMSCRDKVQPLVHRFASGAVGILPEQKALNSSSLGYADLRNSYLALCLAGLKVVAPHLSGGSHG